MPTSRPRHTITETPPVHEALQELRAESNSDKVDIAELVVLGARAKIRLLREDSPGARQARERLAGMIRMRSLPVDVAAADEVKHFGLLRRDT